MEAVVVRRDSGGSGAASHQRSRYVGRSRQKASFVGPVRASQYWPAGWLCVCEPLKAAAEQPLHLYNSHVCCFHRQRSAHLSQKTPLASSHLVEHHLALRRSYLRTDPHCNLCYQTKADCYAASPLPIQGHRHRHHLLQGQVSIPPLHRCQS